jgi:DNA-binding response OmpR family regulator
MDYMMPKLDGIQTTKMLRALGYRAPIVALTANTDAEHYDMFLGNGFDDLISKPIDIQRLNLMLNKLIRDKHQTKVLEADGCKPEKDESQSSGDSNPLRNIHPRFAEVFIRDALKSLNILDRLIETGTLSESDDKDLNTYMIHVHGMKGALANLGQKELSAAALKLERYAREGNTELMVIETPSFLDDLRAFVKLIAPEKFIVKGEKN